MEFAKEVGAESELLNVVKKINIRLQNGKDS